MARLPAERTSGCRSIRSWRLTRKHVLSLQALSKTFSKVVRTNSQDEVIACAVNLLVLLCQQFDEVVDTIGFFKNGCFLKNHIISTRYLLCDSVVLDGTTPGPYTIHAQSPGIAKLSVWISKTSEKDAKYQWLRWGIVQR